MENPKESRKKVTLAVAASILFHVLFLLLFAIWMEIRGANPPLAPEPEKPVELTFLPAETPQLAVVPAPPPDRDMIRSDQMTEATTPPLESRFDSDLDTVAAGDKSGVGAKDMPNIEGKTLNDVALQDQDVSLGGKPAPKGESAPQKEPDRPVPQATPPMEIAKIEIKPQALPTPEPIRENEIAIGRATPVPSATPPPPLPKPPSGGQAYQPQTRATRIEGSLSNRGRPSIASRGTPLGRYLRQVENAIGSRWYFYIKRDADLVAPGAVRIIFTVDRSGKVGNLRVLSNTSNESFASTSTQSIMEAEFPPIPDDVASTLYTQRLELPFTFTIY